VVQGHSFFLSTYYYYYYYYYYVFAYKWGVISFLSGILTLPTIILASACVLGIHSTYKGTASKRVLNNHWHTNRKYRFIPFCPEQMAGFPTPRPPVEIVGGDGFDVISGRAKVLTNEGDNVTHRFMDSLDDILMAVQWIRPSLIVLQQRSPSCSCAGVYDGTFTHTLITGHGVIAAYLKQHEYPLIDIEAFKLEQGACQKSGR
jgi:uncharacterized protein YbbK (DUF523 family)